MHKVTDNFTWCFKSRDCNSVMKIGSTVLRVASPGLKNEMLMSCSKKVVSALRAHKN